MERPQTAPASHPEDDLVFHGSPATSIGIELEVPVLDREDYELSPGAPRILRACAEEGIDGATAELMQSMLEVRTGICEDVSGARVELCERLRRVRNIAESLGYCLALFGTHPSQRINASALTEDERYAKIANKLGWITYHRVAFGLHVHVGVSSGDEAIRLTNLLVQYLPHLLAVSANSPFWQGVDTGLASARAVLYGLVAHSGVPRYMARWKDFRNYVQVMRDCNAVRSFKGLKWDIRPRPDLGTIEFRICDTPASISDVFALAAMIRSLVISGKRLLEEKTGTQLGDQRREWITAENRWLSARYGLDAVYIRTPGGKRRLLRQEVSELLERLQPIAAESGDEVFLGSLQPLEKFETGAQRQRRLYRAAGDWRTLIQDAAQRLEEELKPLSAAA